MFIVLFLILYALALIMIAWGVYCGKKEGCIDLPNTACILAIVLWPICAICWVMHVVCYYIDNKS